MSAPVPPSAALPYGRQWIDDDDIAAVVAALTSDVIAQGPKTQAFETAFADKVGARHAVATSSGTAALHLALAGLDVGPGDVCIVPAITFLSTATAARFCGAEVAFADVDPHSGLMTPDTLAAAMLKAGSVQVIVPVHLGGRLCDMAALADLAAQRGALVVEDASHAVGGMAQDGRPVGSGTFSAAATFSFHPVKTLAAGEGGMVALNDEGRARRLRRLRNHGVAHDPDLMTQAISKDEAGARNPWSYEQLELGFNYRMTDLEAALGLSQLRKLDHFVERRRILADQYDARLAGLAPLVRPVPLGPGRPGLHLQSVLIDFEAASVSRGQVMARLAETGIGSQVHYIPLYRQPYFKARYGARALPGAEAYYAKVLTLPLYPAMADSDVDRVTEALATALAL